ncbi:hypothetical protein PMIN02_001215 [Paraphaeosphaeria minitans]
MYRSFYSVYGPLFDPETVKAYETKYALAGKNKVLIIPGIGFDTVATTGAFWKTLVTGKDGSSHSTAPQEYGEVLSLIVDECLDKIQHIPGQPYTLRRQKGLFTRKSLTPRKPKQTLDDMRKAFHFAMYCHPFSTTENGHFCLVPKNDKGKRFYCCLQHGNVLFVVGVQKEAVTKRFKLIGGTYADGIKKGEAFDRNIQQPEKIRLMYITQEHEYVRSSSRIRHEAHLDGRRVQIHAFRSSCSEHVQESYLSRNSTRVITRSFTSASGLRMWRLYFEHHVLHATAIHQLRNV